MTMNPTLPFKNREEALAKLKERRQEFAKRLKYNLEKIKARDEAATKQGEVKANG